MPICGCIVCRCFYVIEELKSHNGDHVANTPADAFTLVPQRLLSLDYLGGSLYHNLTCRKNKWPLACCIGPFPDLESMLQTSVLVKGKMDLHICLQVLNFVAMYII